MSETKLFLESYKKLVDEDIAWLINNTERSLERDHIIDVLIWSIDVNYGTTYHKHIDYVGEYIKK